MTTKHNDGEDEAQEKRGQSAMTERQNNNREDIAQ